MNISPFRKLRFGLPFAMLVFTVTACVNVSTEVSIGSEPIVEAAPALQRVEIDFFNAHVDLPIHFYRGEVPVNSSYFKRITDDVKKVLGEKYILLEDTTFGYSSVVFRECPYLEINKATASGVLNEVESYFKPLWWGEGLSSTRLAKRFSSKGAINYIKLNYVLNEPFPEENDPNAISDLYISIYVISAFNRSMIFEGTSIHDTDFSEVINTLQVSR